MKIQYFGTAAAEGWPAIFCRCDVCTQAAKLGGKNIRTRSQALINDDLLIDFPPDSYAHMLTYGLNLPEITDILITHSHQDHFYPEDFIMRCGGFSDNTKGILHIYSNDAVAAKLEKTFAQSGVHYHREDYPKCHILQSFSPISIKGYIVLPLPARHNPNEKCYIYLIEKEGKSILYANDTGLLPPESLAALAGKKLDLVSMDCTMMRHKEGTNHMGLPDNLLFCEELKQLGCVDDSTVFVVTHFSHHGGMLHHEIENAAQSNGFVAAYDGLTIEF